MQAQTSHKNIAAGGWKKKGKGKWKWGRSGGVGISSNGQDQYHTDLDQGESSNRRSGGQAQNKGGKKKFDKRKVQRYNYNKWGHFANEYWSEKGGKGKQNDEANLAQYEGSDSDQVLLMVTRNSENDNSSSWYLNTGCSNHMIGRRDWLIDFDANVKNKVRFVDNRTILAKGIGKVMIRRKDGKSAFMNDVLYVPTMKTNLPSLGQLLEKGFSKEMKQNYNEIFDYKHKLVLKAPLSKNRTFRVNLSAVEVQCFSTTNAEEEKWLWHCYLAI